MYTYSESCAQLLLESGYDTYYAFETARDMLLNRKPAGINIVVIMTAINNVFLIMFEL